MVVYWGEHPDTESGFICGACGYPGEWLQDQYAELLHAAQALLEHDTTENRQRLWAMTHIDG